MYARVWHHVTSLGIGGDLARRGQFDQCAALSGKLLSLAGHPGAGLARDHGLERILRRAVRCNARKVWISYQGAVLWAAARYYRLSGDRSWLDAKLPALLQGMDWVMRNRRTTMKLEADGTKAINYGWLPPGRVGDSGKGDTNGIYSDASAWLGMNEMADMLGASAIRVRRNFRPRPTTIASASRMANDVPPPCVRWCG